MNKTYGNTEEGLMKAEEVLAQKLKGHAQNHHTTYAESSLALITDSLSLFRGIALAHKILKSKIDLKGE